MFILFTLGRSLLISDVVVFLVLKTEYISQKKDMFLIDPDPNLLYTNRKQAGRVILVAQMQPVLLSVFRLTATG